MEQKIIKKIEAMPQLKKRLRVAAYCRVSSGKDAMLHSLSSQVSYYNRYISEHEGWDFAGIYADEAISGTKDIRDEFQRLIKDCKEGKIDLILVKAISRFARNTMTMLENVRELKAIGVDVFFEEQNLHTLSQEGEMVLTFLSSFAQEEARSVSENMKWRIRKDFEKGMIWGGKSMYGYTLKDRKLILVPEQAEVVRNIFQMYLDGFGFCVIANRLDSEGIPAMGGGKWNKSAIHNIISNYCYTGGIILQKTYHENYLTKKKKVNKGEKNFYVVDDDHEPIVTMETFMQAQDVRRKRTELFEAKKQPAMHSYSGLIRCGCCGHSFRRRNRQGFQVWNCITYDEKGKEQCHSKAIREDILDDLTKKTLGLPDISRDALLDKVDYIEAGDGYKILYHLKDGVIKDAYWQNKSRKEAWTDEMKEKARRKAYALNGREVR